MRRYQEEIDALFRERKWQYWEPFSINGRLYEELGELSREINHRYGDKKKRAEEAIGDIEEEIGDVLYTVVCLANRERYDLAWVDRVKRDYKGDPLSAFADLGWRSGVLSCAIYLRCENGFLPQVGRFLIPAFRVEPAIGGVIRALDQVTHQCRFTLDGAFRKAINKVIIRDKDRFPNGI